MKFDGIILQVNTHRLTSYFQDGGHGVISHRQVLPSGDCIHSVHLVSASNFFYNSWYIVHSFLLYNQSSFRSYLRLGQFPQESLWYYCSRFLSARMPFLHPANRITARKEMFSTILCQYLFGIKQASSITAGYVEYLCHSHSVTWPETLGCIEFLFRFQTFFYTLSIQSEEVRVHYSYVDSLTTDTHEMSQV